MWKSSIGLRLSFKKRTMCASSFWAWAFVFFQNDWMGSMRWTWVLNLLKSFGFQTLDLGLDSNKVMRASRFELGLWLKNKGHVNFKPWVWTSTHSRKIRWTSSLGLGLQFKQSHMNLNPWAWALTHSKSGEPQTFGLGLNSSKSCWS